MIKLSGGFRDPIEVQNELLEVNGERQSTITLSDFRTYCNNKINYRMFKAAGWINAALLICAQSFFPPFYGVSNPEQPLQRVEIPGLSGQQRKPESSLSNQPNPAIGGDGKPVNLCSGQSNAACDVDEPMQESVHGDQSAMVPTEQVLPQNAPADTADITCELTE